MWCVCVYVCVYLVVGVVVMVMVMSARMGVSASMSARSPLFVALPVSIQHYEVCNATGEFRVNLLIC